VKGVVLVVEYETTGPVVYKTSYEKLQGIVKGQSRSMDAFGIGEPFRP